jgi:endonuclease/exonuclease/phosphatase family metal-dependent hydrolase
MKKLLKFILIIALPVIAFFAIAGMLAYRPQNVETLHSGGNPLPFDDDSIKIITWNIGYASMDSAADFFMDGGSMVRRAEHIMRNNITQIALAIKGFDAQILLLQEVDADSRRSWHLDQNRFIQEYISGNGNEYCCGYAYNLKTWFIPIPLTNPLGRTHSGMALCSRLPAADIVRYAYPSMENVPYSWFSIKRCFAAARYPMRNGKFLVVIGTHNSAFDDGSMREAEIRMLSDFMQEQYRRGNYVIAGGDWNQTPPSMPCLRAVQGYAALPLPAGFPPHGWQIAADTAAPTLRFANQPYSAQHSIRACVDFFVYSPNVVLRRVQVVPMDFKYSDHQPVTAVFSFAN